MSTRTSEAKHAATRSPRPRAHWAPPSPPVATTPVPARVAAPAAGDASTAMWRDSPATIIFRRLLTVPGLFLVSGLYLGFLPLALACSLVGDLIRRRPLLLVRFHLTMAAVVIWHLFGLLALFYFWLVGLRWLGYRPRNYGEWNRRLEGWWGSKTLGIAELIYGMRMKVAGDDQLTPGPILVFARHTSVADTMLPLRILEHHHGLVARIVKKRELLWDPCIDSIGHRLPRTFLRRGSGDRELELDHLRILTRDMGARDALWIYPEGTRFTPEKRRRVLERLRRRYPDVARRAERLRNTLPPRPAGPLTLLDQCAGIDVVFCAHTGLEGAHRLEDVINGSLLHKTVEVQFWRVPAAEIPRSRDDRLVWLHDWWERIDRWVDTRQNAADS